MDRRQFLKAGMSSAAGFTLSGLILSSWSRLAKAAPVQYELVAEQVIKPLVNGAETVMWQYVSSTGEGPGKLLSSLLVKAGDQVEVTLYNNLDRVIDFSIPGLLENTTACPIGGMQKYQFEPTEPGTYLYHDKRNGLLSRAMGLSGPLIVLPRATDPTFANSDSIDVASEYTLFLNEIDSRVNSAIANGEPYSLADYQPNYFFVNGLSYPDTAENVDTFLDMAVGTNVGIRMINGGLIYYPMHFHGYHVDVLRRNRQAELEVVEKDTVMLSATECVDVLLKVDQAGRYPLHTHYLPGVTANGTYGQGCLVMMNAV